MEVIDEGRIKSPEKPQLQKAAAPISVTVLGRDKDPVKLLSEKAFVPI